MESERSLEQASRAAQNLQDREIIVFPMDADHNGLSPARRVFDKIRRTSIERKGRTLYLRRSSYVSSTSNSD